MLDPSAYKPRPECSCRLRVLRACDSNQCEGDEAFVPASAEEHGLDRCVYVVAGALISALIVLIDKRAKLLQEILGGIRIIKFFSWEVPFLKRIGEYRTNEI